MINISPKNEIEDVAYLRFTNVQFSADNKIVKTLTRL